MKPIILCCGANGRAVVYGRVETDPVLGQPVRLYGARMVLYWSTECGGLFGLAARGPKTSSRLTAAIPALTETVWQESLDVSETAATEIERWPAS